MTYYVITRNGVMLGLFKISPYDLALANATIHEFDGPIPDLNTHVWDSALESLVLDSGMLTKLDFLNRFTLNERLAIRASADPVVADIMKLLEVATYVSVHDAATVQGVNYLASVNLVEATRVMEILA